jgi:hypothetical protein
MWRVRSQIGINRRTLLSTLALLPNLPGGACPCCCTDKRTGHLAAVLERWGSQAGHPRLRSRHD